MKPLRPRTHLGTHDVTNQPPPFVDVNLYAGDAALKAAVAQAGAEVYSARLSTFGTRAGSAEVAHWADDANRYPPRLRNFDRYGQRIDEVEYHPAYHELMALGLDAGVASAPWCERRAGHVLHAALEFLMSQAEPSVCCPMTMTFASLAALSHQPDVAALWRPRVTAAAYDPASAPAEEKRGATIGMAMTEKQGGSDLRSNTTRAMPLASGWYSLTGHKWFCSAPMSDAFLTLAITADGPTCFLAPRWTPDRQRNAIEIVRLKDKLGDRANASAEIEYRGAAATRIGEEGRGIRTIIDMVQYTRLDCMVAAAAFMRQATANALWHTAHRSAFRAKLIDQPAMRAVLADLVLESEAATALTFRVAHGFDEASLGAFARIATPIGKYWLNKRVVGVVYEAMEAHGGGGYVEDSVMARLYRQAPVNSIWEGSGNVICLDVLRALEREPQSVEALLHELDSARGGHKALDEAIHAVRHSLGREPGEAEARRLVETMALALQGAILVRRAPNFVADGFCSTRLANRPNLAYGASGAKIDEDAIIARAMPAI